MKLKDVFEKSVQFFKDKKIESARLDAEILLSHVLKLERLQIYLKYEQPLSEIEIQNCREVVRRRGQGEPVAYITGEKGFFGEIFSVGDGVLIPRPETELIVEEALKYINENNLVEPRILDLGAGSGCIGLAILKNCTSATLVSIEKSEKAYVYLQANQQQLNLTARSQLILHDVIRYQVPLGEFDIIVANPPYIDETDPAVDLNVRRFEPSEALFAHKEGLADIIEWSAKYKQNLKNKGIMLFEIGYLQGVAVKKYFENELGFANAVIVKDLSGLDRVLKVQNNLDN